MSDQKISPGAVAEIISMPTDSEHLHAIIKKMQARHMSRNATAVDAAIGIWTQLERKFGPLIGPRSVRLIYMRSLEFNKSAFTWIPAASQAEVTESPFIALRASYERRQPADVTAANCALLATFIDSLATLIGVRLTIQFLRSVFRDDDLQEHTQENPE